MKTIALLAFAVTAISAPAAEATGYKSESKTVSEIFTSNITRVFSAADGDYRFVAYAVQWRDQEVIVVIPPFSSRNDELHVGDAVRCEMRQMPPSTAAAASRPRMIFTFLGRSNDSTVGAGLIPNVQDEAARLRAITGEIERRRVERDATGAQLDRGPQKQNQALEPTTPSGRGSL